MEVQTLQPGALIGAYRVARKLGEGAMGVVYEAVHEPEGRRAAVKILHPQFSNDAEVTARFFNEARAANMIAHPGIVKVYEFGHTQEGRAYMAMELLECVSLRAKLKGQGWKLGEQTQPVAGQIASALAAAHRRKIVHRDLKPDNIMLLDDPALPGGHRVKILDFGIAKLLDVEDAGVKTQAGMAMGTPTYMSPEQFTGAGEVNDRADVYSAGVMFYLFVAGKPPFVANGPGAMMALHVGTPPRPLQEMDPAVAPAYAALVHRMLAKKPEERPAMAEVVEALRAMGVAIEAVPEGAEDAPIAPMPIAPPPPPLSSAPPPPAAAQRSEPALPVPEVSLPALPVPDVDGHGPDPGEGTMIVRSMRKSSAKEQRRLLPIALMSLLLGSAAGSVGWMRLRHRAAPPPPQAEPAKVRWSVKTEPPGAQVLRVEDNAMLGLTPYESDQFARGGSTTLLLRLSGHVAKRVTLANDKGADLSEKLDGVPDSETTQLPAKKRAVSASADDPASKKKKRSKQR